MVQQAMSEMQRAHMLTLLAEQVIINCLLSTIY
jgi:hypothetical protein